VELERFEARSRSTFGGFLWRAKRSSSVVEYRFPKRSFLGGKTREIEKGLFPGLHLDGFRVTARLTKFTGEKKRLPQRSNDQRKSHPFCEIHVQQVKLASNNVVRHSPAEYFLANYLCRPRSAPIIRIPTVNFLSQSVQVHQQERKKTWPPGEILILVLDPLLPLRFYCLDCCPPCLF